MLIKSIPSHGGLKQYDRKCGPRTDGIWQSARKAKSGAHRRPGGSDKLSVEPQNLRLRSLGDTYAS